MFRFYKYPYTYQDDDDERASESSEVGQVIGYMYVNVNWNMPN